MRPAAPSERAFIALALATILVGIAAFAVIARQRAVFTDGYEARLALQQMQKLTLDAETGVRGYAATGRRIFLQPYDASLVQYPAALARLRELSGVAAPPAFQQLVDRYDVRHRAWQSGILAPLVNGSAVGGRARALQLAGKTDVDAMRALVGAMDLALTQDIAAATRRVRAAIAGAIAVIVLLTVVLGAVAVATERRHYRRQAELLAEIDRRNVELQRSNQSLQEFAYVASHDLQEPLRTVASFTQLLQKRYGGALDATADEYIAFAVDGATRMQQLIADVLQYSRVTTHGATLEDVPLQNVLEKAEANLYAAIRERGALIEADVLPHVSGDRSQLVQLLQNLIGNALKYNASVPPRVGIAAHRAGDEWTIAVRDNGIGIDPAYHERIFGMFQRLHGRTEYAGTGIGLALCKRIVERHGGRIWLESAEGQGTTIYFTLRAAGTTS